MHFRYLLYLSSIAAALQEQYPLFQPASPVSPKRVAVIGAGSAGASTAYYLQQYAHNASIPVNITIYERADYVGGRSKTTHVYGDPSQPALELGASIFVSVNHNLVDAARALNLSTHSFVPRLSSSSGALPALGIYDGTRMVLVQQSDSWWELAKLVWRYGTAPYKTIQLMKRTVGKFLRMYDDLFPFPDLGQAIDDAGLADVMAATGQGYMERWEIKGAFGREVVQASTRVNYAINLADVNGVIAMVCMATDGAMSIDGGNWQMFAGMIRSSGATLSLEQEVESVVPVDNEKRVRVTARRVSADKQTFPEERELFDEVVIAAPWQYAGLETETKLESYPDKIPFVTLYVTLLTSRHRLDPKSFGLPKGEKTPRAVLTTLPDEEGLEGPDFNSVSLLREVINPTTKQPEFAYKVFTMKPITTSFLRRIFGLAEAADAEPIDEADISWIYKTSWNSYPEERPRITFEEIRLANHVWYTGGIESFISTMETSSLMGKNVARLMVDEWIRGDGEESSEGDVEAEPEMLGEEIL